jgi:hypothetical protein
MAKLKLTVVITYDANPAHYGASDPDEMAKIDQENFRNQPDGIMDMLCSKEDVRVTVEAVKP